VRRLIKYSLGICGALATNAIITHDCLAEQTALLSLSKVTIPIEDRLTEFKITTWGARVLSVCHVPDGWRISVFNGEDPEGSVEGTTTNLHGSLTTASEGAFRSLFLVRIQAYQAWPHGSPGEEFHPATFSGQVTLDSASTDAAPTVVSLHPINFEITPARHCPWSPR
jgi:hypothetical protein